MFKILAFVIQNLAFVFHEAILVLGLYSSLIVKNAIKCVMYMFTIRMLHLLLSKQFVV